MKCAKCGFENDADAGFCENCGVALPRVCAACGSPLKPGVKFCKKCGTPVMRPAISSGTGRASENERRDRLSVLRQSAPQDLQDKILATRDQMEGERKPVTILFTDMVGSTALAEKLDPEEWKEIVNGAHRVVSEAVYRYEGTIAQLLGDGVLAFFGAPITHEDDPVRAVRAGLDIQQAIVEYSQKIKGIVENLQLRVGIHTGTVVVGQVGSDLHMEYLAIGDAVNLAARLQSAAQPGKVLISEATARLVKPVFDLNGLGEITLKGKSNPIHVFEVSRRKAVPRSGRGIEGLVSPLIGRDQELAALCLALSEVSSGQGQIVAILGEAGIGKSRLVEEARRVSDQSGKIRWLEGRALSYGQTLSFWTVIELIKNDLGLSDAEPEARIVVALRKRVQALFGDRTAEVLPYLAHLMGVKLGDELEQRVRVLDGETLKRQVLLTIGEYFNRAAQEQPMALVFEDLHWADPSTLDALEILLALTDRSPLLLVLLSRAEREHGSWKLIVKAETDYAHRFTDLHLKPLSAADSSQLVDHLLDVANLPEAVRRLILERSEGNPFYLEEIIRSLIEQGALVQEGQDWRAAADISRVEIPETLQGVLLARIDRLEEDVRRTLQLAAVIGKTFLFRLLEAISAAEQALDEHLATLQRADLVREKTRRPELEYMFKHALTQEAAYNSLLIERREEFHRKVGEALEQLFADRQPEFYGLLAHHFEAAGDQQRAIAYWIKAGDKGRLEDALDEAIRSYQRALELLKQAGDHERSIKTWLKLGLCYHTNCEFDLAHQANEAAFALERLARASQPSAQAHGLGPEKPRRFRMCYEGLNVFTTFDPAKIEAVGDGWICMQLFAGLAELDSDTNVVPHAARSWEVLDGGTRYLFHLRDDARWSDGAPVTAQDFEWTWKHNLAQGVNITYGSMLDDILGARDYREGRVTDPESVGVRALDPLTLEVRLIAPAAHFIYLVTLPLTFPLPLKVVELVGKDWWRPETIVSNGAFRLLEYDAAHGLLERNPDYFGEFRGNLDQFEWNALESDEAVAQAYRSGLVDFVAGTPRRKVPVWVPANERHARVALSTEAIILNPTEPPLDDVRVRRAIAHALDRERGFESIYGMHVAWYGGGFVPPGMPGHSPEIGLGYDLARARQLLAEAGYSGGKNLPILKYYYPYALNMPTHEEFKRQLLDHLGIRILIEPVPSGIPLRSVKSFHILGNDWAADYPDPGEFLRQYYLYLPLRNLGWRHPRFEQLLEEAAHMTDRAQRLAMYREADRILVNEEIVVVPWSYFNGAYVPLVKPWVKGRNVNALNGWYFKDITIEPHG